MLVPALPPFEQERLKELRDLAVLDSEDEPLFDEIVKLSSYIGDCPISLISLVDVDRQWFKAKVGLEAKQTSRNVSFCAHAIHQETPLVVENALDDPRFADNPLVTHDPHIRFYAGHPLTTSAGHRLGTLCVIDRAAKKLTSTQLDMLGRLARQASSLLERRRQQREIEIIRRNSQNLFEKIPAVVVSMKGPDHIIDYISSNQFKLFGDCTSLGKPLLALQPEAKESGLLDVLDQVFRKNTTQAIRNATFTVEGIRRHFDFVCTPSIGLDGTVDGVMGVYEDITDRVRLERAIHSLNQERQKKHQQLAQLLEALPMGIAMLEGPDHRFVFANQQYRRDFITAHTYADRLAAEVISPKIFPRVLKEISQVRDTNHPVVRREQLLERQEDKAIVQPFYCDLIFHPMHDSHGTITGILIATQDVSEQVRNRTEIAFKVDELQKEREIRERFVAALTHDLRTPLTTARMTSQQLIRQHETPAAISHLSSRIIRSIDRAEGMVRDLLDANRLKAGQSFAMTLGPCSPQAIFDLVVDEFKQSEERIIAECQDLGDTVALWDADAIERVLENLLSNAIKYGDKHAPIHVRMSKRQTEIEYSVHNRGRPLSSRDQATLFEPYRRGPSAAGSGEKGWGIGLTLVKSMVEAHRGIIHIHSQQSHGTTFSVRLPLRADFRGEKAQEQGVN